MNPEYTSRPDESSATIVQKTVASARFGFSVKTRQQTFESCGASKTSVTPADSASGGGSDSWSFADVQAASEVDITRKDNANRRS